jgi:hypothetical protein
MSSVVGCNVFNKTFKKKRQVAGLMESHGGMEKMTFSGILLHSLEGIIKTFNETFAFVVFGMKGPSSVRMICAEFCLARQARFSGMLDHGHEAAVCRNEKKPRFCSACVASGQRPHKETPL